MHVLVAKTLSSTTTVAANTHVTTAQQLGMVTRAANYHADTRSVLLRNVPFVVVQCSSRRHLALFFRTLTNQVINNEVQTSCFITRHCRKHILVFLGQVLQCIQGDKLVYSSNKVFIFEEEVFLSVLIEQTRNGFRISQEATTLNTSVHVSSKLRHLLLIQSKVSRIGILNVGLKSRHTFLQIRSTGQHLTNVCFAEESTKNSQVSLSDTTEQAGPFLFGQLPTELTCNGLRQIFTELLTCLLHHRTNTFDQVIDSGIRFSTTNKVIQQCPERCKSVHLVHGCSYTLSSKLSSLIGGQHAQHLRTGTDCTSNCIATFLVQSIAFGTNYVRQASSVFHDDFVRPINTTSSFAGQLVDEHLTILNLICDVVLQGINSLLHVLAGAGNTSHAVA